MLNLDTNIVLNMLQGSLTPYEQRRLDSSDVGISAIVLWELAKLHQQGKTKFGLADPVLSDLLACFTIWPLDAAVALASTHLDFRSDPADEIIAATSVVHRISLLTRDKVILASKIVPLA